MKRSYLLAFILLIVATVAFAGGNRESASAAREDGPIVLTMLTGTSQPMEGLAAVIEAAEERLNIRVEVERAPAGTEHDNIVRTRLATGDMSDMMIYNVGSLFHALNPSQHFVDLSNEPFIERLEDSFVQTVTSDGAIYGIPLTTTRVGGWLYNKRVYEELGLTVPRTWDQLIQNLDTIRQNSDITPVIGAYRDSWTAQIVFLADNYNVMAADPSFADEFTAGRAKFADHPAALRSWEKLAQVGTYLNSDFLATTHEMALEMLINGEGAHYPTITNALSVMFELYGDAVNDIGVFGQPGDDPNNHGVTVWMPGGMFINRNGSNVEAAKRFFEFFISDEALAIYSSRLKPDGPYAIRGVGLPDDVYPGVQDLLPFFEAGRTAPALELITPVKGPNAPQLTVEAGAGIRSPREAAAAYDRDVEQQAIQLNLPGW